MTVTEAIAAAETILPGRQAPDGEVDPRWQAVFRVGEFIESEPEAVWQFALRWGKSPDTDLRMAVATCVLEHILEYHFDTFIDRFEEAVRGDAHFASAVSCCSKFGRSEDTGRSTRFDRLQRIAGRRAP